ncbi:MAG: Holliday junction branch migration protein RuvA [Myxococcales bacterium]|nr:Holliday junction branch migration protein RuvA [Myxococcales bacterium]
MIAHLRGVMVEKSLDRVVVDVGGVGYHVVVSMQTLAGLPAVGAEVFLKTYLQVREDAHVLFGFAGDGERRVFELCISVSGIGPKLAMAMLSALKPEALAQAVIANDLALLTRTPGVGKKTAERVVVELRDKFEKLGLGRPTQAGAARPTGIAATVASALINLGYRPIEAERAAAEATRGRETAPLEQILKEALRTLTE